MITSKVSEPKVKEAVNQSATDYILNCIDTSLSSSTPQKKTATTTNSQSMSNDAITSVANTEPTQSMSNDAITSVANTEPTQSMSNDAITSVANTERTFASQSTSDTNFSPSPNYTSTSYSPQFIHPSSTPPGIRRCSSDEYGRTFYTPPNLNPFLPGHSYPPFQTHFPGASTRALSPTLSDFSTDRTQVNIN